MSYQWRLNSSPIAGASAPSLLLTNVTTSQVGLYDLVVTGALGSVTSTPAAVALFDFEMLPSDSQLF